MPNYGSPSAFPTACARASSAILLADIAALRAQPAFVEATLAFAAGIVSTYSGSHLLNRLMNDRGRFVLSLLVLDMHFESLTGSARGGLTSTRLKAQATGLGLCSPGRAGAVLATFRLMGLVTSVPDPDRRLNRLAATEKLIAIHRQRWHRTLEAMAGLMPEGTQGLERLDQHAFLAPFISAFLLPFREGWRMVDDVPELAMFTERDGGMVLALSLLETGHGAPPRPIAHLARHFRLSRSHIVGMLQEAEQAGLVHRPEPRGGAIARPALIVALEKLVAVAMLMQAQAVRHACACMEQRDRAP
ncbi:hypothetical protein MKI84_01135 [Ancylobacter sp. A5.8]|uniref:hypothetical protein n=1 Tax=Ancylobacter gelatini TaxID=2919920 RepID=UPI001F4E2DAD|nr:hypothetical protein [Ancylobacter gelatini]MCJ8141516.1 hypothetical protein [Ancylobacter gelatini]